jgi:hypothetical protein
VVEIAHANADHRVSHCHKSGTLKDELSFPVRPSFVSCPDRGSVDSRFPEPIITLTDNNHQ